MKGRLSAPFLAGQLPRRPRWLQRAWDEISWKRVLGFVAVTWIVGIVVPALAQYGESKNQAAQAREKVILFVAKETFPLVEATRVAGARITSPKLGSRFELADLRSHVSVFTAVPRAGNALSTWMDLIRQYGEYTHTLAPCVKYQQLPRRYQSYLIGTLRDQFRNLNRLLKFGPVVEWNDDFCLDPKQRRDMISQLAPGEGDYERFVEVVLRSHVRGYQTSRIQLVEHIFLPWKF